jgi:hypothetical protein
MENGCYLSHRVERQSDVFLDRWFQRERTLLATKAERMTERKMEEELSNNVSNNVQVIINDTTEKVAIPSSSGVVSWNLALFTILVSLVYVSDLLGRLGAFLHSFKDRPQDDLQVFAQYPADKSMIIQKNVVDQLPTDSFKMFAQAACAKQVGTTVAAFRQTLALQLRQLPLETRTEIIESAVIDGDTQKNSDSNTVTHLSDDVKASSYLAFWSTTYSKQLPRQGHKSAIRTRYHSDIKCSADPCTTLINKASHD